MKYMIILITFFLTFLDADIQIVASSSCGIDTLSHKEIKDIFLLKKRTIRKKSIFVLDRSESIVYKTFVKEYMHKSLRKIKAYWVRMLFTGKKIPPKKIVYKNLNNYTNKDKCYLTYIKEENIPSYWKKVDIK